MQIKKNVAISDSGFVFNPVTGESFTVNPSGQEILNFMKEGASFDEIKQAVMDKYQTDENTFEKDFQDFIDLLQQFQISTEDEKEA